MKQTTYSLLSEVTWVKGLLISIAMAFMGILIVLPLLIIFVEAFSQGINLYLKTFSDENALAAIKLTLIVTGIAVPLNMVFGIAASWAITKYQFGGKQLLISLINLPITVSPVVSGLIYVLLFNMNSTLGEWLYAHNLKIIYAVPGLVLATIFVTLPFVAQGLIPLMQKQGVHEEEAAILLGANGWQTFRRITLPNIKWALLYSVLLCNARAMGEFGAVSVISGHILGQTTTVPLYVEILYNEFNFTAAFAMASILTFLAFLTLILHTILERKYFFR